MDVALVMKKESGSVVNNASSKEVSQVTNDIMSPKCSKSLYHLNRNVMGDYERVHKSIEVFDRV